MNVRQRRLSEVRQIVAHAIGLTPADMSDEANLLTTFAADWRAIGAAMSRIESKYGVNISTDEIGEAPTILSIYRATVSHANWDE
jgi:transcriptional regulatory protein LevR